MADSSVPITAGSGTPIRVLTALGAGSADQQVMTPADQYGNLSGRAYGPLKVSQEEHYLFLDTHDAALDTTNRWNAATGTNAPSVSSSVLSFGVATTVSAFGKLTSQPTFSPPIPGFLQPSFAIKADAAGAAATGGHRFWGVGTSPAVPATTSAATKLNDAIGWEIDTDGKLYAVVYSTGGTRTAIDLSATGTGAAQGQQPLDGGYHRYLMQIRTDRIYWFIDSLSFYVATMSFTSPSTQTLGVLLQTINPASAVAAGGYPLSVQGSVVADTASNHSQLSDGLYPWRKATVKAASTAAAATDLPLVVAHHPSSPTPSVADVTSSNTINATDAVVAAPTGGGAYLTGTSTSGSYSSMPVGNGGYSTILASVTGTFGSGTVYFEQSLDSTDGVNGNWTTCPMRLLGPISQSPVYSTTTAGLFQGSVGGAKYVRARIVGATTPSVAVNWRLSASVSPATTLGTDPILPSSTGTITSPAVNTASFTALAANVNRKGALIFNDSVNTVYLAYAATASTTAYTVQIPASGYYEVPSAGAIYTGILTAISTVASGNLRVTELT